MGRRWLERERERVEEEEEKEAHSTPAQGGRTGLPPTAMPVRGWPSHLQVLQGHLGHHWHSDSETRCLLYLRFASHGFKISITREPVTFPQNVPSQNLSFETKPSQNVSSQQNVPSQYVVVARQSKGQCNPKVYSTRTVLDPMQ